jgi:hypothetical protein
MKNRIKTILAATVLAGVAGVASAFPTMTLNQLLSPGSFMVVGDKIFDNFGWNSATIPSTGINIQGIDQSNPLWAGNFGIDIQGSFTQVGPGSIDGDITYRVRALRGHVITDIHQLVNGFTSGPGTVALSSEQVFTLGGVFIAQLGQGSVNGIAFPSGFSLIVPSQIGLLVNKDINLTVGDAAGALGIASISDIQQTFSQDTKVPDGGTTVALLGLALLGIEGLRRKVS